MLLTNFCVYDCAYCVNRLSSDTPRARFKVEEIVDLTLGFYRRNMIEGLFLSSGIAKSEDHTMEEMVRVAETLRRDHDFRGYIHLKAIAGASQELMERAGRAADRLSVNVELPADEALARLAPQKDAPVIRKAMGGLRLRLDETKEEKRKDAARSTVCSGRPKHADDHWRRRGAAIETSSPVPPRFMRRTGCDASTIPPSALFLPRRKSCRFVVPRSCANTVFIRPTGSCGIMVLRLRRSLTKQATACSTWSATLS